MMHVLTSEHLDTWDIAIDGQGMTCVEAIVYDDVSW